MGLDFESHLVFGCLVRRGKQSRVVTKFNEDTGQPYEKVVDSNEWRIGADIIVPLRNWESEIKTRWSYDDEERLFHPLNNQSNCGVAVVGIRVPTVPVESLGRTNSLDKLPDFTSVLQAVKVEAERELSALGYTEPAELFVISYLNY